MIRVFSRLAPIDRVPLVLVALSIVTIAVAAPTMGFGFAWESAIAPAVTAASWASSPGSTGSSGPTRVSPRPPWRPSGCSRSPTSCCRCPISRWRSAARSGTSGSWRSTARSASTGFAYAAFVNDAPWLAFAMSVAYQSMLMQAALAALLLPVLGQGERLKIFIAAFGLAALATIAISAFTPAVAIWAHYAIPPERFPNLDVRMALIHMDHVTGLRDGSFRTLMVQGGEGIITFPSFHTAFGVLLIHAFWRALVGVGPGRRAQPADDRVHPARRRPLHRRRDRGCGDRRARHRGREPHRRGAGRGACDPVLAPRAADPFPSDRGRTILRSTQSTPWRIPMRFSLATRRLVVAVALAGAGALVVTDAFARPGQGRNQGSRGSQTYSAPAATPTAPRTTQGMERSAVPQQPARPAAGQPAQAQRPGAPARGGAAVHGAQHHDGRRRGSPRRRPVRPSLRLGLLRRPRLARRHVRLPAAAPADRGLVYLIVRLVRGARQPQPAGGPATGPLARDMTGGPVPPAGMGGGMAPAPGRAAADRPRPRRHRA